MSRSASSRTDVALRVRVEGGSIADFEQTFTGAFTIGRGLQATVHVASSRVSRLHAEVRVEDGQWVVRDAGSTNGTYAGGERIAELVIDRDVTIRLGQEGPYVRLTPLLEQGEGRDERPEEHRRDDDSGTEGPSANSFESPTML